MLLCNNLLLFQVYHGDVIANGFSCTGEAEAVFLDIPKPWEAIKHAITAFKPRGNLCDMYSSALSCYMQWRSQEL